MQNLAIITGRQGWHVRDLERAASLASVSVETVDFRSIASEIPSHKPNWDAVLVRTMPPGSLEQVIFRMDVLHHWQALGIPVMNPPRALELCIDKYLTTVKLQRAGFSVPPTMTCQDSETALQAFQALGSDVLVKPLFGSEGRGMLRVSDVDLAWRVFRTLERVQSVLYLQQFVPHFGYDLRAFVLGGRILAAMKRSSEDWRTNVAQGGRAVPFTLTDEQRELALQVATALDVPMAGVDLLPGKDGTCYVLELNAVPGWRRLSKVSRIDVASAVIGFVRE